MPWPQDQIIDLVVENCMLTLCLIKRIQQSKGLIVLLREHTNGLSVALVYRWLRSCERRRHYTVGSGDYDIEAEMMATELDHPGFRFARLTEDAYRVTGCA